MLRPSYTDLLEQINKGAEGEDVVGSRYTIVIAAAKRARQLIDCKCRPMVEVDVNELYEGKIVIKQGSKEEFEETAEEKADSNDAVPVEPEFLDTMEE